MLSAFNNRIFHVIKSARGAVSPSRSFFVLLCLPWLILLGWMAALSWGLLDDAFISFRYARNLLEGHGLVFNPGERVEGYTNFLWTLELAGIWGLFGVRPEHSAPWLSVFFTAGTLIAVLYQVARMPSLRHRGLVAWMSMGLLCGSATFAVWTSAGGLETRQFTFHVVAAVVLLSVHRVSRLGLLSASFNLGLASLTRPEGLLIAGCCIGWFLLQSMAGASMPDIRSAEGRRLARVADALIRMLNHVDWRAVACLILPFALMVCAHLLFRVLYYGELLPNTYYAKFVRPWWDMGLRYYAAVVLETGLYLLIPLAVAGAWIRWRLHQDGIYGLALLCVALHTVHVARVGGDLFEWRPLDFYWPLLAVPAADGMAFLGVKMVSGFKRIVPSMRRFQWIAPVVFTLCVFALVLFYSSAMQFALMLRTIETERWASTLVRLDRRDAAWLFAAPGMSLLYRVNEELRMEMPEHSINMRFIGRPEILTRSIEGWLGPYEDALRGKMPKDAVTVQIILGHSGYFLTDMTVIDYHGLTDKTVARNPDVPPNEERRMAQDRVPPYGYLDQRGVNMLIWPPARSEDRALERARYALQLGEELWMPFDAIDHQWVQDRFGGPGLASAHDGASGIDVMNDLVGGRDPEIRSGFYDVHIIGDSVVYVKSPCIWDDVDHHLYLYLVPADGSYISQTGWLHGFDQLSFNFWDRDVAADPGACVASVDLPGYKIASVKAGHVANNGAVLWEGSYSVHAAGAMETLRELQLRGDEPEVRSGFDVFVDGSRLIYHKPSCSAADIDARVFLHAHPADIDDLPLGRRESGFDNLDFILWQNGGRVRGECVAMVVLPAYEIFEVRTGQLTRAGEVAWSTVYSFVASESIDAFAELRVKGAKPAISSYFDVFVEGNRLIYHKPSCSQQDIDTRFFLHVHPANAVDLPLERRESGFDNLDFSLWQKGGRIGGECVARVDLPGYEITSIATGQLADDGHKAWDAAFSFALPEIMDDLQRLQKQSRQSEIASVFDVFLYGNRLMYHKLSCSAEDVGARFFLHVHPADAMVLPPERRESGFDNLDFSLSDRGGRVGDECVARVELPEYEIASVRTGQYTPEGSIWEGSFEIDDASDNVR